MLAAFIPSSNSIAYGDTVSEVPSDFISVKRAVQQEFGTSSVMVRVARCESTFRQFDKSGSVLRGYVNPEDVGIFQVNEFYHLDKSIDLEFDIYTIPGNIKMARYLYDKFGTDPWSASKPCWSVPFKGL